MLVLTEERVGLLSCQVLNIVMEVGDLPADSDELENSVNVDFTIISESDTDKPVGIDVLTYLKVDDGSVFSLDLSARVLFDFPDDYSNEDAAEYLAKFGTTRAFDSVRPHIEYICSTAGFTMSDIPPIVATMD